MKKISTECEKTYPSCVIDIEEDTDMNDKSILEGLFRQHYGKMTHLARTLLHDDAEAQDVVQDVFARLGLLDECRAQRLHQPHQEDAAAGAL